MSNALPPQGRARRFLDRRSPPHIATLIVMASISAMAMNSFLPSLPNMTAYFQTEYRLMQLSVALYLGVSAIIQLFVGPISDRFGRRPVVLWGIVLFLVATLGCLVAPTAEIFLFFRMCQAVIAVCLVLSRAIVRDMVPQDQAASMIGYVTMGMAVVPMIGPAIGGVLDGLFGWRANFWLLLILGAGTFWLCWSDQGETATPSGKTWRSQFHEVPELLRAPRFWGYALSCALSSGTFFAYLGGAPFVGSVIFGLSPSLLGVLFGSPAIGYVLGNYLTGRYAVRFGVNRMVLWGAYITGFGVGLSLLLFLFGYGSAWVFFGLMCFVGLGNGLSIPNATAGMLSVRPNLAGTASGLGGAIMIGGGAALSAVAGAMLTPQTGAFPLLYLMLASAMGAVLCIVLVVLREKQLARLTSI